MFRQLNYPHFAPLAKRLSKLALNQDTPELDENRLFWDSGKPESTFQLQLKPQFISQPCNCFCSSFTSRCEMPQSRNFFIVTLSRITIRWRILDARWWEGGASRWATAPFELPRNIWWEIWRFGVQNAIKIAQEHYGTENRRDKTHKCS